MNKWRRWVLGVLLLYLIYEPPFTSMFLGVHQYYVNTLVVAGLLLLNIKRMRFEKRFIKTAAFFLIYAGYTLAITTYAGKEIRFFQHVYYMVQAAALYMLNAYVDKKALNPKMEKVQIIREVVVIEFVSVILMLTVPAIRQFGIDLFYSVHRMGDNYQFLIEKRIYGIFGDYTFKCQVFSGILSAYFVFRAYTENCKLDYLFAMMAMFTSVMNGRTGLLIAGIMIAILILVFTIQEPKRFGTVLKALCLILVGITIAAFSISMINPKTFRWIINMFKNLLGMSTGNIEHLESMVQWPITAFGFILGTGIVVYGGAEGSDIGYCNDINLVGIPMTILLYVTVIGFLRVRKKGYYSILNTCLVIALLVINVKGVAMRNGPVITGILWIRMICESGERQKAELAVDN